MQNLLQSEFFKNYESLVWSSASLIIGAIVLGIIKNIMVHKFKKKAEKSSNKLLHISSEIVTSIKIPLLLIIATYFGVLTLELSPQIIGILHTVFTGTLVLQIILILQAFINIVIEINTDKANKELSFLYKYLGGFLKAIVWIIGILLFLSNIGYDVSSLIASLGIGGLAIALAVQNILKDIFSSFMILINRPFQVGDYVELSPTETGTIKKIGIKNTIIKTVAGSELIVTNDDILNSRIYNYRTRKKRRVPMMLNLDLNTSKSKIEKLKEKIIEILESDDLIDKEDKRVTLDAFTPQAIVMEIVFFIVNDSFDDFVHTKDRVNMKIKDLLEKEKVDLAKAFVGN